MTRLLAAFLILNCFFVFPAHSVERYDRARSLLEKMSKSLHERNYRGLFTYEVGGGIDNYKIVHQVRNSMEFERLEKLNGTEKEILRSGRSENCLQRGDRFFRSISFGGEYQANASKHYFFHLTGKGRVAGRDTLTVQVLPKDVDRYGYVFSIDKNSYLPLQVLMLDPAKKILERIQFIDIEVDIAIDDTELLPRSTTHVALSGVEDCQKTLAVREKNQAMQLPWRLAWLPAGYRFLNAGETRNKETILTYSDGLSAFSVVIGSNALFPAIEGQARLGGTAAFVTQYRHDQQVYSVTVLGEIPIVTAQKIAKQVSLVQNK